MPPIASPMETIPELPAEIVPDSVSSPRRHIKPLDGLRGIAILLVFTHHFFLYHPTPSFLGKMFNGFVGLGWSGVDLFFVLSGFLITGILLDTKEDARYFRNFYARRTLRIFPLYYGMLFLCTIIIPRLSVLQYAVPAGGSWWWWVYLSNFRYAFVPNLENGWLGFFWSLAVEEHFYLVWPAVIYFCNRRSAIVVSIICIILATVSRSLFIHAGNHLAPYVLTPCRMDSLASGALIALMVHGPRGFAGLVPGAKVIGAISATLALALAFWRHSIPWDPIMQLIGYPLITCSYACLIAVSADPSSSYRLRRALENRVLRSFGKYSYGMYVFHGAVGSLLDRIPGFPCHPFSDSIPRANDVVNFVILTTASFTVAFISWNLYEKQFLKLKRFFEYNR